MLHSLLLELAAADNNTSVGIPSTKEAQLANELRGKHP